MTRGQPGNALLAFIRIAIFCVASQGIASTVHASDAHSPATDSSFGFGGTAGKRRPRVAPARSPDAVTGGPSLKPAVEASDFSLSINGAIPDLLSATLHWRVSERFGLDFRAAPETLLNVRVEMPADLISTKKNVGVANPPYTITSRAGSGPGVGLGAVFYPYLSGRDGGGWFVGTGVDQRRFTITGKTKSPVLICSLIEAQKDPPCGNLDAALVTRTQFVIDADMETSGISLRGWTGWRWNFGATGSGAYSGRAGTSFLRRTFFEAALGAERMTNSSRKTDVAIKLDTPGLNDADTETALGILRDQNAGKSEDKLKALLRKYDSQIMPVAWMAAGFWL
jgi:hypothetical protein